MATLWPTDLPQEPLYSGYSQVPNNSRIESAVGYGPPKVRRRTTLVTTITSITLALSQAEVYSLSIFYQSILEGGTLPFQWIDFIAQNPADFRFTTEVQYSPRGYQNWFGS